MKVQFLIDNKKSWIIKYIKAFINNNNLGHKFILIHSQNLLKKVILHLFYLR